MNKFRVTCLILVDDTSNEKDTRVFATRTRFTTREAAQSYADTVAPDRKPMIGYVQFFTNYDRGHWTVYDEDEFDGPGSDSITVEGDRFAELQAIWDFCELFNRCTVFFDGVPCGGHPMSVPDEGGSGWKRCDGCSML